MAFLNRVGSLLKQNVSKHFPSGFSASNVSLFQGVRSMSTSSKVFIGGLSYTTDEMSLREAFSQYGEVIDAKVILDRDTGRSRGFAFVTYASPESASSAIQAFDGQDLHGRRIKVNYATERPPRSGGFGGGGYGVGGGYGGGGGFNYGGQGGNYGRGGYGGADGGFGGGGGYQGGYQSRGDGFANNPYPNGGDGGFGGQDNYSSGGHGGFDSGNNFPSGGYTGDGNYAGQTGLNQEGNNNDLAGDENGRDGYGNEEVGNYSNTGR